MAGAEALRRGRLLPALPLLSAGGAAFDLAAYRGRNNLVLLLAGSGESALPLLRELARREPEFGEETTQVLAVVCGAEEDARAMVGAGGLPFPVLADPGAAAHRALGAVQAGGSALPAVVVTDRYGEIGAAWSGAEAALPGAEELLEWARFLNIQCEECFPPEWPPE